MAQDFAKSRSKVKPARKQPARAATRHESQSSSHWSWFFSGLFSGLLLCVVGYFGLQQTNTGTPLVSEPVSPNTEAAGNDSPDLQFYEYLPRAEVAVNVVPVEVANPTLEESNPASYLLQAASFQDPNDAEALRAKLILLNLQTRIVPTPISGRTWYRVQAGPFTGRAALQAAENTLIENNIDPIRLRVAEQ